MYHSPLPAHLHIVTIDGGYCLAVGTEPENSTCSRSNIKMMNELFWTTNILHIWVMLLSYRIGFFQKSDPSKRQYCDTEECFFLHFSTFFIFFMDVLADKRTSRILAD
jgi:hypothetical protein